MGGRKIWRTPTPRPDLEARQSRRGHRDGRGDYTPSGNLFRRFTAAQKERWFQNVAEAVADAPETIVQR